MATPERDSQNKILYHEALNIFHEMIVNLSLPLKNLVRNSDRKLDTTENFRAWINNLRLFKNSALDKTIQNGFDQLHRVSKEVRATDKTVMVEQSFVLQLCAVSWSLSEICTRLRKTIVIF